jgi:hypothetical protein
MPEFHELCSLWWLFLQYAASGTGSSPSILPEVGKPGVSFMISTPLLSDRQKRRASRRKSLQRFGKPKEIGSTETFENFDDKRITVQRKRVFSEYQSTRIHRETAE